MGLTNQWYKYAIGGPPRNGFRSRNAVALFKFISGKFSSLNCNIVANFKRAVGHSFYAGRLLEDTRVCTKCRRILFMVVSKATKLLKLGHSDFDQVYAMVTETCKIY